jgi:peptidoglycan DL-endopeptidase LytE
MKRTLPFLLASLLLTTPAFADTYVVKKGDNLSHISKTTHLSLSTLMQLNHLHSDRIYTGQTLLLSAPSNSHKTLSNSHSVASRSPFEKNLVLHVSAQKTSKSSAKPVTIFHFTHKESSAAASHFKLKAPSVAPLVAIPTLQTKIATSSTHVSPNNYVVKPGDNLYQIAVAHQMPLSTLMHLNGLSTDRVYAGQTLILTSVSPALVSSVPSVSNPSTLVNPVHDDTTSSPSVDSSVASPAPFPIANPAPKRLYPADFVFSSNDPLQALIRPLLGTPYIYGGSTPGGFDCSGFTAYVFREIGIALPRVSADQFTQGQAVDPNQLQEGDLLFYDTAGIGKVSHVAIYLGNQSLVHASEKSVVIDTLDHMKKYPLMGVKRFALLSSYTSVAASN